METSSLAAFRPLVNLASQPGGGAAAWGWADVRAVPDEELAPLLSDVDLWSPPP